MNSRLPQNKLVFELNRIGRLEPLEQLIELQKLCLLYRYDSDEVLCFFNLGPYTGKQGKLAFMQYIVYGVDAYREIKNIFPSKLGKLYSCWDDFMLDQVERVHAITYTLWKYHNGFDYDWSKSLCQTIASIDKRLEHFIYDIEYVCDDDLYIEMLCAIKRNSGDETEYLIDYEYMRSRYGSISSTDFGAKRFISLLYYLAQYNIVDGIKAWGDFYYLFEELYESHRGKHTIGGRGPIGGDVYTHEILKIFTKRIRFYDSIKQYGWLYLHHAFEIYGFDEYSRKWLYKELSDEDKIKADKAMEEYRSKQKHISENVTKTKNTTKRSGPTEEEREKLIDVLINDQRAGLSTWVYNLHSMEENGITSKAAKKRNLDDILWRVGNYEEMHYDKTTPILYANCRTIHYCCPNIYKSILDNEWLSTYLYENTQMWTHAYKIGGIPIVMDDMKLLERLCSILRLNVLTDMSVDNFLEKAFAHVIYYLEWSKGYISATHHYITNKGETDIIFVPRIEQIMQFVQLDTDINWRFDVVKHYATIIHEIETSLQRVYRTKEEWLNA